MSEYRFSFPSHVVGSLKTRVLLSAAPTSVACIVIDWETPQCS